ncbi:MAG: hypothetical protein ACKVOJ_07765 [Sphingomonadaceae bacterium]
MPSDKDFDWIGPGIYFWEADKRRALEWAQQHRAKYPNPTVIGAVIDLRNCLDLTNRTDLELVREAHSSYVEAQQISGLPIAENLSVAGQPDQDRLLRYLDCAVIRHLHYIIEQQPKGLDSLEAYDTVRGMFSEGEDLYLGAGFKERTHTQIAVINPKCLKGLFFPL